MEMVQLITDEARSSTDHSLWNSRGRQALHTEGNPTMPLPTPSRTEDAKPANHFRASDADSPQGCPTSRYPPVACFSNATQLGDTRP